MMRSALCLSLAAGVAVATPAAAETRTFDLAAFDRIDVSAGIKLIATVGAAQSISVETEEGDFDDLELEVDDGVLIVSREWNRLRWHQKKSEFKVTLSVRELRAVEASSGSNASIANIEARNFTVDISSGAYVDASGRADDCNVDISSGANLDGRELVCDSAKIDVSSGGHGDLTVRQSLQGDASSGGHVAVYGNPEQVELDRSSGGRIKVKSSTAQAKRD